MFDVEYGPLCTKLYSKPNILISLGNTSAEHNGIECTVAYSNIESRFPNIYIYIIPKKKFVGVYF